MCTLIAACQFSRRTAREVRHCTSQAGSRRRSVGPRRAACHAVVRGGRRRRRRRSRLGSAGRQPCSGARHLHHPRHPRRAGGLSRRVGVWDCRHLQPRLLPLAFRIWRGFNAGRVKVRHNKPSQRASGRFSDLGPWAAVEICKSSPRFFETNFKRSAPPIMAHARASAGWPAEVAMGLLLKYDPAQARVATNNPGICWSPGCL